MAFGLLACLGGRLPAAALVLPQSGQGMRAPASATAGSTVIVECGTSDPSIEVTDPVTGTTQSFPVAPGKRTPIPIPAVPPGSILVVSVGRGLRARVVLIEVVAP